ncbi:MAG: hypothetical protein M3Y07_04050, partial [Acidobacteriota bacterium]|nr:hypothetical protein [Acidobacteriota bacterium]
ARWGPVFNRYRKRFRIGLSTFGRSRLIPRGDSPRSELSTFVDLKPLDIALDPAFHLETSKTAAEETVLNYRATRATRIGYADFEPGDAIQFVISTREGIGAAVEQARRIHGYCAGVVFFRWPTFNETLDVLPDDVLTAAGVLTPPHPKAALRVVPVDCAAVDCADLYLVDSFLSPQATPYQITSLPDR